MKYSVFAKKLQFDKLEKRSIEDKRDFACLTHFLQSIEPTDFSGQVNEDRHFYGKAQELASSYFSEDGMQMKMEFEWDVPYPPVENPDFTFIDLFAGIGGFRIAMQELKGKCVFSSEWDKFAQKTYAANFGEVPFGDIREFTDPKTVADEKLDELIPNHDVLCAGFPCQPFSLAGVSKKNSLGRTHGFLDETQGTLFFDIARILTVKRPKAFVLENVKNLRSHDKGKTYKVIRKTLEKLNYTVFDKILDGKYYVPQHRERIFFVGFANEVVEKPDFEFPEKDKVTRTVEEILEKEVSDKYTHSDQLWKYLQDYAAKHKAAGNGFGFGIAPLDGITRTLSARYHKDGSEILIEQEGRNPRKLTPKECAALQGYDSKRFSIPVSDTQAYRQFGNSVVVPLIKDVSANLKKAIESELRIPQRAL